MGKAARRGGSEDVRRRDGRGDEWLRVGGLKGFIDGSLGSHTAAFEEPFATRRRIAACW